MKTNSWLTLLLSSLALPGGAQPSGQTAAPLAPTPYAVTDRGASHRVWERLAYEPGPGGRLVPKVRRIVELATGLHYQQNGQFFETREAFTLLPGGLGAAATNGPHQAYVPASIYSGVFEWVAPDAHRQRSRPVALCYSDGVTNVLLAELSKDSIGQVLPSGNQVLYPSALTGLGLTADLLVTYRKSGIECDAILRARPPTAASLGLDPVACTLQLYTEFFDTPDPAVKPTTLRPGDGVPDATLSFGGLKMTRGQALSTGAQLHLGSGPASRPGGAGGRRSSRFAVCKSWVKSLDDNRVFLVEELPWARAEQLFDELAAIQGGDSAVPTVPPGNTRDVLPTGKPLLEGGAPEP